jgi:CHAD domain-containing protein
MPASPNPREFASARAGGLLDALALQLQNAVKAPDAHQIHDLRVATRRFSQALVIWESCFQRGTRSIRKRCQPAMKLSSQVRDLDIALKMLGELDDPAATKAVARIRRERAKSMVELRKALVSLARPAVISKWRAMLRIQHGGGDPADTTRAIVKTAERFFDRYDRVRKSKKSAGDPHPLRIATKKLRYTLELGAERSKAVDTLAELQSALGEIHDLQSVRGVLSEHHAAKTLLHPLKKKQRSLVKTFRKHWDRDFGGKKHRATWMARVQRFAKTLGTT